MNRWRTSDVEEVGGGRFDPDIEEGIAAAVADALWFLARQWQVGEFRGEDAATPIVIEADVTRCRSPSSGPRAPRAKRQTVARTQFGAPLEALVGAASPSPAGPAGLRLRLESGAALLRRLAQAAAPTSLLRDLPARTRRARP